MSEGTNQLNRIKPVIILPTGEITPEDIKELRENGFCVVEAKNPDAVRFMEPPPLGYSAQEKAAIQLCRYLLRKDNQRTLNRDGIASLLSWFFISGSTLDDAVEAKHLEPAKPRTKKPA